MKTILSFLIALCSSILLHAQDIDSMFYSSVDTTGFAKAIAKDEAEWHWTDTLDEKDYSKVDAYVSGLTKRYKSIPKLAKDLTAPFDNDEEKVRAIFMWMNSNIVYDYIELAKNKKSKGRNMNYSRNTPKEVLAERWEKIYYKYATDVLTKRRGICEGYSTLFYELCKNANIKSEMVNGFADMNVDKVDKYKKKKTFPTNHAWNRVFINDEWLYIDVTWASCGTFDGKRTESNAYRPYYFLKSEKHLYVTHIENEKRTKRRNDLVGNY